MKLSPRTLATLFILAGAMLLPIASLTSVAQAERPNFLFVLVDDLGSQDLGYAGSTFYESPNIDALAASGMRFNQGYAACRVCSPSRASIMTGKATARHGVTDWIGAQTGTSWNRNDMVLPAEYVRHLPHEDITIAEAMRDAGYKTFFAGKWHLGDEGSLPTDHGFEINKGGYFSGSPRGGYFSPYKNPQLDNGPPGQSLTLRLAEETASFIDSNKDEPFFAFLSFYTVHSPIQTTEALCRKYQQKARDMGLTDAKERFKFDRRLPVRQVQDNPIYAGMIETMDSAVGVVLDKLKETGLDKNTVVIFTSDNGGVTAGDNSSTGLLPLRGGKGKQWEGGTREPVIVHVPGVTSTDSQSEVPVIGMDFYPTILELAGLPLKPKQHVDGVSLVPLLKGESIAERDLFWHYPHYGNQGGEPSSVILSGHWKLIYYHEDGRNELYDLKSDVSEQNDLVGAQPEKAAMMRQKLDAFLAKTNAKVPARDPRFTQEAFDKKIENARTKLTQRLERQHANFLNPSYAPKSKESWWGSVSKPASDFQPLFNGKDLTQFTIEDGTAPYRVEDGVIIGRTLPKSPNTFLATKKAYGDFELTFETKISSGLNSGVQIRSFARETAKGKHAVGRFHGPQVEIEDSPGEAGNVYGEAMGGGWLTEPLNTHSHFKNGQWNSYRVIAKGASITTFINGVKITETVHDDTYASHPSGHIGLQIHSTSKKQLNGAEYFEARWRNLQIKKLSN